MENNTTPLPDPNTVVSSPASTPQVVENSIPVTPPPNSSPKRFNFRILGIILGIIIVILIGLGSTAVAIAYEKIDINNPDLERKISYFVQNIPFVPKTPRFVLEAATIAHGKVSKHKFDLSIAAKSDDFSSSLGLNQIDVEALGNVDYSDPNNIKLSMNGSVTKDFNFDIRKSDTIIYLKINKIPDLFYSFLSLDKETVAPIFENWIGIDTKPLDTEARRNLDKNTESEKSLTSEYVVNTVNDLLDEKLLPHLKVDKENMDNYSTHKVHLEADAKTIDNLVNRIQDRLRGSETKDVSVDLRTTKPSDYIKDLVIDMWVDEKSYYVRKIVTSFKYNPNYQSGNDMPISVLGLQKSLEGDILGLESSLYSLGQSESSIVTVVKFDEFGQDFNVARPPSYLTAEEFYKKLMEASGLRELLYDRYPSSSGGTSSNELKLAARSRDATRLADSTQLNQVINVAAQESNLKGVEILCSSSKKYPCFGSGLTGTRVTNGTGWVKVDLSAQRSLILETLPIDPVNNSLYHYVYCANNDDWELNMVLESSQHVSRMASDGGDDPEKYEVGSNLNLIDKVSGCKY